MATTPKNHGEFSCCSGLGGEVCRSEVGVSVGYASNEDLSKKVPKQKKKKKESYTSAFLAPRPG